MELLKNHEQFEMEVLDFLNSDRLLDPLLFYGGSMLRLCYDLDRYSVNLDFCFIKKVNKKDFYNKCLKYLEAKYKIIDTADKHYTMLYEISSVNYPRNLKIEIRKEIKKKLYEESIAYSKYSNRQVLIKTISLETVMHDKVKTFLNRGEIRDCFDIEFLYKKGIKMNMSAVDKKKLLQKIDSLTKQDYKVKLGSIIDSNIRKYYVENNFKILKMALAG